MSDLGGRYFEFTGDRMWDGEPRYRDIQITDEMVERALDGFYAHDGRTISERMHAALERALRGQSDG